MLFKENGYCRHQYNMKKKNENLLILLLAYKNGGLKTLCRDSICLCYATLPFSVGCY